MIVFSISQVTWYWNTCRLIDNYSDHYTNISLHRFGWKCPCMKVSYVNDWQSFWQNLQCLNNACLPYIYKCKCWCFPLSVKFFLYFLHVHHVWRTSSWVLAQNVEKSVGNVNFLSIYCGIDLSVEFFYSTLLYCTAMEPKSKVFLQNKEVLCASIVTSVMCFLCMGCEFLNWLFSHLKFFVQRVS